MRIKKKILLFVTSYSLLVTLAGCGYTARSMISDKYKTIYVEPFVNKIDITKEVDTASKYKIYRPYLETDITKAVIDKFLFDGNLKPLRMQSADLILKGEVTDYRKDPLSYDENDEVTKYRMNVVVNLSLRDNREDKLLWEEKGFTGYVEYFTSFYPIVSATRLSDAQAISSAIDDLARRVISRVVEQW